MLVNRRTFIVKSPHYDEAIALLLEARQLIKLVAPNTARIYTSNIGPFDVIALEVEHESLSAYEHDLAAFNAHPVVAARVPSWFSRWGEITAPGGMNEIWSLAE